MANFYFDESFDETVGPYLTVLGHTVLTPNDDGRAGLGIDDPSVVERATQLGRAVITYNRRHFVQIHRSGVSHAGIIYCTTDGNVEALAARIDAAVRDLPSLGGLLIRVVKPNSSVTAAGS